ncbi:MAG: histidine kinase, partial [Ferruginibacter sp.]
TEKEGLSNNTITSILEDKNGNLWFGTELGFSKLEKDKLSSFAKVRPGETAPILSDPRPLFKTYTYDDGFSGIGVNFGKTIHEANDGTIWIGSNDRLTAFHPGTETRDTLAPNIQLTGVTLFNETIAWQNLISDSGGTRRSADNYRERAKDTSIALGNGVSVHDFHFDSVSKWYDVPEHLSLAYDNNYLSFQFVGITMQSPKKVKYRFKLEGLDENWSALTDRTEAPYGNLPHGKYTFKVRAMNSDGYWSREFNYSFTIRPPWWFTWWAYVLYIALLAVGIWSVVYYRLKSLRRELEERKKEQQLTELKQQKTEFEMQALRAQMNPHFVFNSLNSINMFILENNKLQASEYLSKFSRLVRLILQNSQEAFIPLEKELEALQLYLELESLRFEQKFGYKISIDDEIDTTALKVPPLIIQPYVENAIWHGLMHKKEKGHLEIELYQQQEILFCRITDDGVGRKTAAELRSKSASTYKSVGMGITASRIALIQQRKQNETSITINDLVFPDGNPGGTEVLIKIPLSYD